MAPRILFGLWLLFGLSAPAAAEATPQILDGLWSGTFDINNQGRYDFTALYVGGRVAAYSVDSNVVYRGTVAGDDKSYRSDMLIFLRDGTQLATVKLKGTVGNRTRSIVARYQTSGDDTGTLGLVYNPLFKRPVALHALEGLWEYSGKKVSISININATGEVKGTDNSGCNLYGTLRPIRPDVNALDIQAELASCGTADGQYAGMAYVADGQAPGEMLHWNVTGAHFGMYYPLRRVASAP